VHICRPVARWSSRPTGRDAHRRFEYRTDRIPDWLSSPARQKPRPLFRWSSPDVVAIAWSMSRVQATDDEREVCAIRARRKWCCDHRRSRNAQPQQNVTLASEWARSQDGDLLSRRRFFFTARLWGFALFWTRWSFLSFQIHPAPFTLYSNSVLLAHALSIGGRIGDASKGDGTSAKSRLHSFCCRS